MLYSPGFAQAQRAYENMCPDEDDRVGCYACDWQGWVWDTWGDEAREVPCPCCEGANLPPDETERILRNAA